MSVGSSFYTCNFFETKHVCGQFFGLRIFFEVGMSVGSSWDLENFLDKKHVCGQFLGLRKFSRQKACLWAVLGTYKFSLTKSMSVGSSWDLEYFLKLACPWAVLWN